MERSNTSDGRTIPAIQSIDVAALEEQLSRLWRPGIVDDPTTGALPTRSSVLNLIVYAASGEVERRTARVIEQLSQVHSSRIVVFNAGHPVHGNTPNVEIYSACSLGDNRSHAPCVERIDVPINADMLGQLPSLIAALIIPELPTFLWWPGTPPFSELWKSGVLRSPNLLIIDSHDFSKISTIRQLTDSCLTGARQTRLVDLNWMRLRTWRELTAQFFEIQRINWSLECVREVEIEAGELASHELPAQALLFASWLAHGLSWTMFDARRTRRDRWYFGATDQNGDPVRIIIRCRPTSPALAGHLLSLGIISRSKDGRSSSLSLNRSRGSAIIRMHAKEGLDDTQLHHAVHHPLLPEETLLIAALETTGNDHVFEAAARRAAAKLERMEGTLLV